MLVYPVIHYKDDETSFRNCEIIFDGDYQADGVFLIAMNGKDKPIVPIALKIKDKYPNKKIGINLLRYENYDACKKSIDNNLDMIWSDKPLVNGPFLDPNSLKILELLRNTNVTFFSSFAFKYQKIDKTPNESALTIQNFGLYPVTSGESTGTSADLQKIKDIHNALKSTGKSLDLAIASGLTPENISSYKEYITCAIVATGISKNFDEFDADKFDDFMRNI